MRFAERTWAAAAASNQRRFPDCEVPRPKFRASYLGECIYKLRRLIMSNNLIKAYYQFAKCTPVWIKIQPVLLKTRPAAH